MAKACCLGSFGGDDNVFGLPLDPETGRVIGKIRQQRDKRSFSPARGGSRQALG